MLNGGNWDDTRERNHKISKDFDEFLVLLAQVWIELECIYIKDVDKFYKKFYAVKPLLMKKCAVG